MHNESLKHFFHLVKEIDAVYSAFGTGLVVSGLLLENITGNRNLDLARGTVERKSHLATAVRTE